MNPIKHLRIAPAALIAAVACAGEPERSPAVVEVVPVAPAAQDGVDFTTRAATPPKAPAAVKADTVIITQSDDGGVKELRMHGDDVRVIINGKVIEHPVVKRDGDRMIVLGKDGEQLTTFEYEGRPGAVARVVPFGANRSAEADVGFFAPSPPKAPPPPVMLGISLGDPGPALRSHLGLGEMGAILVENVVDGTPADRAGLERWDIIVSIDGSKDAGSKVLHESLMSHKPGDQMRLWVIRGCEKFELDVKLAPYDASKLAMHEREDVEIEQAWPAPQVFKAPSPHPFVWRDQRDAIREQLSRHLDKRQIEEAMGAMEEALGKMEFEFQGDNGYGVFEFKWDGDSHKLVIPKGAPQWRQEFNEKLGQNLRFGREQIEKEAAQARDKYAQMQHELEARMDRLAEQIDKLSRALERMNKD